MQPYTHYNSWKTVRATHWRIRQSIMNVAGFPTTVASRPAEISVAMTKLPVPKYESNSKYYISEVKWHRLINMRCSQLCDNTFLYFSFSITQRRVKVNRALNTGRGILGITTVCLTRNRLSYKALIKGDESYCTSWHIFNV